MTTNLESLIVVAVLEKVSFHSHHKKGQCSLLEFSNQGTIAFILHVSKVMFNILQVRLQEYVIQELLDVQVGFQRGRGTRDQILNICWITEWNCWITMEFIGSQWNSRKFGIYFCFIDYAKAFHCVDHKKLENS